MAQILGDVNQDESIEVTIHRKYKCALPSFGMLGNSERRTKVQSINMHAFLKDASKTATWFFWSLIELRNPKTNLAKYVPADPAEAHKVTKAYKELDSANIIKRVRRGEYLINPASYIPSDDNFTIVKIQWDSI